jgi:leader peptidase (prepilin peptidase)/N-methyltransferase
MGFGDVKFIACIGAFLGWQAVLFTVFAASMIGLVFGTITIAIGRRELSTKIPFGPYLSAGALLWLFSGRELVAWYLSWAFRPEEFGGVQVLRAIAALFGF